MLIVQDMLPKVARPSDVPSYQGKVSKLFGYTCPNPFSSVGEAGGVNGRRSEEERNGFPSVMPVELERRQQAVFRTGY